MMHDDPKQVIDLEINQLQPNPLQPRGIIASESLNELVNSVKEHGILEPLVVAHTPAGYQIIAGERRWRAAKVAGLARVPVLVKETSPRGMLEMALVENVQREDLNPLERAKAFQKLLQEFSLTSHDIAQRIGKSISYVSNSLNLLNLPDALKDGLLSGIISEGHARALLAIRDIKMMVEAYKIILRESASVRRAEELSRKYKAQLGTQPSEENQKGRQKQHIIGAEIDNMQEKMQSTLGEHTKVKLIRSSRQTRIQILLNGSPEKTRYLLEKIYQQIIAISSQSAREN